MYQDVIFVLSGSTLYSTQHSMDAHNQPTVHDCTSYTVADYDKCVDYLLCLSMPHQIVMAMQNTINITTLICGSFFSTGIGLGGTLQFPKRVV